MNTTDLDWLRELVRRDSGIVLDASKEYLLENRLTPVARELGLVDVCGLVQHMRTRPEAGLRARVVDAMTTNETSFFRDVHPFEALRSSVIPRLAAARQRERRLSVWCAAASTGQEPYSIAMTLRDALPDAASWRIDILGTDLSNDVLAKARSGRYSQLEVNRGLPAPLLVRWFERHGAEWVVKPELRAMVTFRQMNLIAPWPAVGPFDLVFVRNVLIYFDAPTKQDVLGRCHRALRPDGALFLGAAESTLTLDVPLDRVPVGRTACYTPRGGTPTPTPTSALAR